MLDRLSDEQVNQEYVLCKIIRYNNRTKLQNESVAEHTCFVSLFCLKILAQLNLGHEIERQVLILAALHDMAESKTSDIPHDVKANYPEMKDILDKIEDDYYKKEWIAYYEDVVTPKIICYEILKLADAYSVYQYCLNERNLGNISKDNDEIKEDAILRINEKIKIINNLVKEMEI